jgi:hypothetical protein
MIDYQPFGRSNNKSSCPRAGGNFTETFDNLDLLGWERSLGATV